MNKKMSLIMFSGDYDKALAALVLANTAKELEIDVTMFFAFWGLFLLRDPEKMDLENKSYYKKIFEVVTPMGPESLPLSKMNLMGLGKKMFTDMMEEGKTPTLTDFLNGARKKGVKFYGCKLSLEVMGLKENEFIPELQIVEAKDYLKDALESDIQLFI